MADVAPFLVGDLATPRRSVLGVLMQLAWRGRSPEAQRTFLLNAGVPPIALDQPDIPITYAQEVACLNRITAELGPEHSPMGHAAHFGSGVEVTSYGVLGLAMMYAPDLMCCGELSLRFPELCWGHARVEFRPTADGNVAQVLTVSGDAHGSRATPVLQQYVTTVDLAASLAIVRCVLAPDQDLRPTEATFAWPKPFDAEAIAAVLGCPVRFGCRQTAMIFGPEVLQAQPRLANPLAFRAYERQAADLAALRRVDVSLAEQVRRLLWAGQPVPDRDPVARMLAMSPRTLARRLGEEGTSFRAIRNEVRQQRAQRSLGTPERQVSEVADELGFSDVTAFSRAFRSWTGLTPTEFRRGS
ncbi:MAG: helix-turn-helix domain-containing protein [Myxococcota bacterium]